MNKICTEEQHDSYTWLFYNILNSLLLRVLSHALYSLPYTRCNRFYCTNSKHNIFNVLVHKSPTSRQFASCTDVRVHDSMFW